MESSQFTDSQSRYEAIEPLERQGATCDTFRVKVYGKLHFLKRLKAEHAGDTRYQEALRKEFETGYRLEHPNLVRYVSLDDDSVLMEYVDGETLTQRLATQPDYFRKRKNTDKFLRQLLSVLDYLHSHQVLHLDLKPDNILLTRINDDVKLIDLGFCYSDTFQDTSGHTDAFAAPEQLSGSKTDARTDIFAIGKVLELFPNHYIYNKVIARCTAERPIDRYQSVKDVAKAVDRHSQSRLLRYTSMLLLIVVAVVGYILLSQGKEHQEQLPTPVDTPTVVPVITTPDETEKQPVQSPSASPSKTSDTKQLQTDISHAVLPKFNATLGALPDSVLPGTDAWAQAGWAMEKALDNTLKELKLSHPDIPMEQVAQKYNTYVQSLITLKLNKAMSQQKEE